jgi:hypothetical protein
MDHRLRRQGRKNRRTLGQPHQPRDDLHQPNHEFDPNAGPRIAYNGSDGQLHWINSAATVSSPGFAMAATTTPAIASKSNDVWEIAYVRPGDGHLMTIDSSGQTADTGSLLAPETNPALTAVEGSGYWLAVQGLDGVLYTQAPTQTPFGAWTRYVESTSPSIAADDFGGWEIAFKGQGGNHLWTLDNLGNATDTMTTLSVTEYGPAIAIASQ